MRLFLAVREDKGMDDPFNFSERKQAHLAIVSAQILPPRQALKPRFSSTL